MNKQNEAGFSPIKLSKMGLKPDKTFNFLLDELIEGIPSKKARGNKCIFFHIYCKLRNMTFLILFGVASQFLNASATAQDSTIINHEYHVSAKTIGITLGASGVFGLYYGGSIFITDKWSIELARGIDKDINLGGGGHEFIYTGASLNRYFLLKKPSAIVVSVLCSRANVITASDLYKDDFTIIAAMIGIDHSFESGFGTYARGGIGFTSEDFKIFRGRIAVDVGICWRFDFFSTE